MLKSAKIGPQRPLSPPLPDFKFSGWSLIEYPRKDPKNYPSAFLHMVSTTFMHHDPLSVVHHRPITILFPHKTKRRQLTELLHFPSIYFYY